jgi:hypothetical protein
MFSRCSVPVSSCGLRSSTYERRLSSMRDALTSWPYKNLQVWKKGTLLTDADGKANKNFKRRKERVVCKMRSATSPRPVRLDLDHRRALASYFTRLDTGQRCSTSFAAGLSNAALRSLSQNAKSLDARTTGMRSCTSATKSFGSVMSVAHDFSNSPVALFFHSPTAGKVIGSPSARVKYQGCLPVAVFCRS